MVREKPPYFPSLHLGARITMTTHAARSSSTFAMEQPLIYQQGGNAFYLTQSTQLPTHDYLHPKPTYWNPQLETNWPTPSTHPPSVQILQIQPRRSCCKLGFVVYRIGPGMYHSGVVMNDAEEWHFWEGAGIRRVKRPLVNGQYAPALPDLTVVEDANVGSVCFTYEEVERFCESLKHSQFNPATYDLLRNNCNHFVQHILQRFGKSRFLPAYVNRSAHVAKIVCAIVPGAQRLLDHLRGER
eukprot:Protomagalhaensia_sp_Gyna_25__1271@NODE_1636_length_1672_cov_4_396816_g1337_i0_p2_GENE_NODE_1636_length_1672_cov_4_396816_g1337_i0NODE_1636_length_1672_cov_4_396816_g1337_i0_p2_ORF_typecomplete_len242_score13_55Peptidase_C97/PF05903_14/6_2e19LRAT/PF04970_13/0_00017DUF778/PF05608_12/0_011DUF4796/PF16044_5/0_11_NODE_1636_length_1672_cov_4_396816_g1337_i08601585